MAFRNTKRFSPKLIKRIRRKIKKRNTPAQAAYTALKMVKRIQKGIEYKHQDYPLSADDVEVGGVSYPLMSLIGKGDENFQRQGDIIKLARAHIYFSVHRPIGFTGSDTRSFRILLVRGVRENSVNLVPGTVASASKGILDNTTMPLILARKSLDNMRDSKILFDKTYTLTPGQATKKEFKWNFKCGWNVQFATGSSNLVENGGLYFVVIADFNNGDMLINMNHRMTFSDL